MNQLPKLTYERMEWYFNDAQALEQIKDIYGAAVALRNISQNQKLWDNEYVWQSSAGWYDYKYFLWEVEEAQESLKIIIEHLKQKAAIYGSNESEEEQ